MKLNSLRILKVMALLAAVLVFAILTTKHSGSLYSDNSCTGWLLVVLVSFLAAYNIRKKLPFLPLGRSSTWLQLHLYLGLFGIAVFIDHTGYRLPDGQLEVALYWSFVLVVISGITGAMVSRVFARRLAGCEEKIIYERIPIFQRKLRLEVEGLISQSVSESGSTWLADFYAKSLESFFRKPRFFFYHIIGSKRPLRKILTGLEANKRYLNETEIEIISNISELVRTKFDLDKNYALQSVLKLWFFVHIPLTYALILLAVVHVILAYSFSGSLH